MTLEKGPLNTEQSVMCPGCHQSTEYDMRVIVPVALLISLLGHLLAQDCCDQVELNVTGEADEYLKNTLRSIYAEPEWTQYAGVYTITDDPELQVNGRQVYMTTPASNVTGAYFLTNRIGIWKKANDGKLKMVNDGKWGVFMFHDRIEYSPPWPWFTSEDADAQCPEDASQWTYIYGPPHASNYRPADLTVTCVKSPPTPTTAAPACKAQGTACTATDTCCDHGTCQDDAGIDVTGETEGNCKVTKLPSEH